MQNFNDGLASIRSFTGKILTDSLLDNLYLLYIYKILKGKILTDCYLSFRSVNISPIKILHYTVVPTLSSYSHNCNNGTQSVHRLEPVIHFKLPIVFFKLPRIKPIELKTILSG